ncbi:DUF2182 domain-containing protein, partial [Arthrobacter deserti]|nr:DUF2182 domain-containing protein [Arthrobacter deserti]
MPGKTPSQPRLPGQRRAAGRARLSVRPPPGLLVLIPCALLAWYATVNLAAGMPPGAGAMGLGLAGFLAGWAVMMTAMMLPSLAPLLSVYLRSIRAERSGRTRALRTAALVAGYLLAWTGFGVLAYAASLLGARLAEEAP